MVGNFPYVNYEYEYIASEEFTDEGILAYIICNKDYNNTWSWASHGGESVKQLAVWMYLADSTVSDNTKTMLLKGSFSNSVQSGDGSSENKKKAKELYIKAKQYKSNLDNKKIQKKYQVKFYILKNNKSSTQRLIWVETTEVKEDVDVSLQKFINRVDNEAPVDSQVLDNSEELWTSNNDKRCIRSNKGTIGYEGVKYNDKITKNVTVTGTDGHYKCDKPVQIEQGNWVTYRIYVYNNGTSKAKQVTVTDTLPSSNYIDLNETKIYTEDGKGGKYCTGATRDGNTITATFEGIPAGEFAYFHVSVHFTQYSEDKIWNVAKITGTGDQTNTSKYRQVDGDSVKTKEYKVSLEKYVSAVNGNPVESRSGKAEYLTVEKGKYLDKTENDKKWTQHNQAKYNSPVEVGKGDYVTYTIKVKNDGQADVYITKIDDKLPSSGISKYKEGDYSPNISDYKPQTNGTISLYGTGSTLLKPGESTSITLTVLVSESNLSLNVLKNTAEITELKNKNGIVVNDKTPWNNKDSDYIQMKDITIAGNVWNDLRDDTKTQKYDGKFDEGRDGNIEGIKVELYRYSQIDSNDESIGSALYIGCISTTFTDKNGYYSFSSANINSKEKYEKYIKAPKNTNNNRWNDEKKYYSYWVVFEYDGIEYTTTPDGKTYTPINANTSTENNIHIKDNNAREKSSQDKTYDGFGGIKTREDFNAKFSTINGNSDIEYTTKNEEGNNPQSIHKYNENMAMKSSTNLIKLENNSNLEEQLQHVDMGLRGRDAFDLHLTNGISSVKVTVNEKSNTYRFTDIDTKGATIRKTDIVEGTKNIGKEDAANVAKEVIKDDKYVLKEEQKIRTTDIKNKDYPDGTGLEIYVTYKITVTNASITPGTATKITDYYDKYYAFDSCYFQENKIDDIVFDTAKEEYNSMIVPIPETMLTPDGTMDIYVVFKLINPSETLKDLAEGNKAKIRTSNMAEITEYKTQCGENQTEFTRGLIDINSAPDSVNKEQVRTQDTIGQDTPTVNGKPTTVNAFFDEANQNRDKDYESNIKKEDDTYIAPMLYFVADGNARTITGTIFEDNTSVDETTKIRSGDGKLGEDENKVNRVQVELIEQKDDGIVRYTTYSDDSGNYTFSGFLPGDYIIRYTYGNDLENVRADGNDKKSYNGEDFQATNNEGLTKIINEIEDEQNRVYWYVKNGDGYSVGKDNMERRNEVSNNVTRFTDEQMDVLNNMREGKSAEESKVKDIIDATSMNANTTQQMSIEVEAVDGEFKQSDKFGEYNIKNMNFGIAQVPVTTIDLQKHIKAITIRDSADENTIAKLEVKDNGEWTIEGDIIGPDKVNKTINFADISIEDEKMQGAKLQVTYEISSNLEVEKNFDNTEATVATITGLVDFINNNLSYNGELTYNGVKNSENWEIITRDKLITEEFAKANNPKDLETKGTVDPDGTKYTTIVKAKDNNSILTNKEGTGKATITLEKVLSSSNATFEEIITSTVGSEDYGNIVEITSIDYANSKASGTIQRDRVIIPKKYIPLAGIQYDWAEAELITIHEPTGVGNSINTTYYVLAVISLVVLAGGVFGIKKFVLKK